MKPKTDRKYVINFRKGPNSTHYVGKGRCTGNADECGGETTWSFDIGIKEDVFFPESSILSEVEVKLTAKQKRRVRDAIEGVVSQLRAQLKAKDRIDSVVDFEIAQAGSVIADRVVNVLDGK